VTAERDLEQFIIRYLERRLHARIWWGAGRPFVPIVQYEDDDGNKYSVELWIDDFARHILDETGARSRYGFERIKDPLDGGTK
jgi:hypothetical protein